MKSVCSSALIAAAILGWACETAKAQGWNYPTGQPTPSAWASASEAPQAPNQFAPQTPNQFTGQVQQLPSWDSCDTCCSGCGKEWTVSVLGLVMGRNRAPAFWTTTTVNDPFNLLMNTQSAGAQWTGGAQLTAAYAWAGCGGPSLAFTYWGLGAMNGFASVSDTTGNPATALSSTIDFSAVTINGNPGSFYFESASQQAIWRSDHAENMEMNLLSTNYRVGSIQVTGLVGFRYFRFTESLIYGSASFGNTFTSNGGADAAYLRFNCRNNLYGGQVGAVLTSVWTERLTAYAIPKVGIYSNQMNNQQLIYSGDAVNTPVSDFTTHKTDASVLSEVDFGFSWAFRTNWELNYGYRVLAVNNVSLGDNQFASYFNVEQSGSVILHGAFIGLAWMY